jgi:YD repeat-containing protein
LITATSRGLVTVLGPNGVTTSFVWDQVDRLTRLTHTNAGGTALEDFQYAYNLDDEIALIDSLASASKRGGSGHSSCPA